MAKPKTVVPRPEVQQGASSLPSRLLTFKIEKVSDIFLVDMAFTVGLAGALVLFKDAPQAILWGILILGLISILIVPPVYLVCRSIEKKIEGAEKDKPHFES